MAATSRLVCLAIVMLAAWALPRAVTANEPSTEGDAEVRESVYVDDDNTIVSTTSVDATAAAGDSGVTFRAGYLADVISSASVDVVSAATGRFQELRNQVGGGIAYEQGNWQADVDYTFSDENDWTSHTANASLGRDFFQRNTNLTLGYVFVHNDVFRAGDDNFHDRLLTHGASAVLTQVLGRKTNARLSAFASSNGGFQSSPYRFVPVDGSVGGTCASAVSCPPESHPRTRLRYSGAGDLIQFVGTTRYPASVRAGYRFYGDTWEVLSHALTFTATVDLSRHFQLRARSRSYFQDRAFFYHQRYAVALPYMSSDRELSTFFHQLSGLKLTYKAGILGRLVDLRFDVKGDVFYFRFLDFARLPQRVGGIVEAGLRLVF